MSLGPTPPPRLGPRPLPLHMAVESWITQLSCAALTLSSGVLPRWKGPAALPNLLPQALAQSQPGVDPAKLDPAQLVAAVAAAAKTRMESFVAGVLRYHAAPPSDAPAMPAPMWREGAACLRPYGADEARPPVLVVPSLINRATVLDLAPDRSFLRDLAAAGFAVYLLDWGAPGAVESRFSIGDYVTRVLQPALSFVVGRHRRPAHLLGYCMGGTLAMAPAVLAPADIASLALLAAPWDFHADSAASRAMLALWRPMLEVVIGAHGVAPVDLLQAMFAALDPTLVGRKFRAFAAMQPGSAEAARFVALEDWLNDGVPLAGPVARECLLGWYGDNTPHTGRWSVACTPIVPGAVTVPALVVVPAQDRIVPPASARALGQALPRGRIVDVPLGHIGMIAGGSARGTVTMPLVSWLRAAEPSS